MRTKLISATGYLTGTANLSVPTRIHSIAVIPGTVGAGSFKVEKGAAGAGGDVIPDTNATIPVPQVTNEGEQTYQLTFKPAIQVGSQCYVTVTNCKLLIHYE